MDITKKESTVLHKKLSALRSTFSGDIYIDEFQRLLHATDASAYREVPLAVTRPKTVNDIRLLINFARKNKTSLIPRTAGTSLAGQVVGGGIVVDVSRYMTRILEINKEEHWVRVEPGVILDELNKALAPHGLFFGPETSTSNRCMIGGMVGNNSCGAHSLIYGSTRDHTIGIKALLSDGSEVDFHPLNTDEFKQKCKQKTLEGAIYRQINQALSNPVHQQEIREQYPEKSIRRRNTGYAIDLLLDTDPFSGNGIPFNFSQLLAGSEGTLAFITGIKLNLVPLPPKNRALLCVHFSNLKDAFRANLVALRFNPGAIELVDHYILEQTKNNIEQRKNRFFIQGDPAAVLIIEFARDDEEDLAIIAGKLESALRKEDLGYHFPLVTGNDVSRVWALRKAGLGLLSNIPGDAKPVAVIEDVAVNPEVLPEYTNELQQMLDTMGLSCTYHAHIATGELHLRPLLNLKNPHDVDLYHTVALETARLVKKYRGSLSGEHGDGRLRGEFIPLMIGENNYRILKEIKATWDPDNILNPGKITSTPPMQSNLRFKPGQSERNIHTIFDFSHHGGMLRAVEQCNGSGDCRKTEQTGGVMCPSYMATRDEKNTTRARANILREFLTSSPDNNPFNHKEIYDVMDLCLSCKGCKSECPSNVDITKYKTEFLQHYYDANGIPFSTRVVANIDKLNRIASTIPALYNFIIRNGATSSIIKRVLGFAPARSIPAIAKTTLRKWLKKNSSFLKPAGLVKGRVCLFIDEFTEYNDTAVGIKAVKLLNGLGYEVIVPEQTISGRTYLSKGLLRKARKIATRNVLSLKDVVSPGSPLIGLEPSGILTFRDEYPALVEADLRDDAVRLATSCFLFEEFFMNECKKGNIQKEQFTTAACNIMLHGHCHQKVLASTLPTRDMLSFPANYVVEEIPSGCCGMAGSFGYEKEHYDVSMKVGELTLFPAVRSAGKDTLIAAPGTSCRQQILDGTGRKAVHPVEIIFNALRHQPFTSNTFPSSAR